MTETPVLFYSDSITVSDSVVSASDADLLNSSGKTLAELSGNGPGALYETDEGTMIYRFAGNKFVEWE